MAHTEVKKQGEKAWDGDGSADGGGRACSPARCQHRGREAGGQLVGPLESAVGTPNFASHPEGEDGPNQAEVAEAGKGRAPNNVRGDPGGLPFPLLEPLAGRRDQGLRQGAAAPASKAVNAPKEPHRAVGPPRPPHLRALQRLHRSLITLPGRPSSAAGRERTQVE